MACKTVNRVQVAGEAETEQGCAGALNQSVSHIRREARTNRQKRAAAQIFPAKLKPYCDRVDHGAGGARRGSLSRSAFRVIGKSAPPRKARRLLCYCKCGK